MIRLKQAVIVEGKYDRIRLSGLIDALIIETGGFAVFTDRERLSLIRRLAEHRGIVVLTDSDSAALSAAFWGGIARPSPCVYPRCIQARQALTARDKLGVEGMTDAPSWYFARPVLRRDERRAEQKHLSQRPTCISTAWPAGWTAALPRNNVPAGVAAEAIGQKLLQLSVLVTREEYQRLAQR